MPQSSKPLSQKTLTQLIAELDQVMAEAANLRREVTRQLDELRDGQQQKLSSTPRRPSGPRR